MLDYIEYEGHKGRSDVVCPIWQMQANLIVLRVGDDASQFETLSYVTGLTYNADIILLHRGVGAEPLLPWNRMLQTQNAAFQPNQYQMLAGPGGYPPRRDDRGGRQVIQCGLWDEKHAAHLVLSLASQDTVFS